MCAYVEFQLRASTNVTVPDHKVLAKGTLNDILTRVSIWIGLPKDELLRRLS